MKRRTVMKYQCPCCGCYTYDEEPSGTGYICPVCYWEDDNVQQKDSTFAGGANFVCLDEARANYIKMGACESRYVDKVRKALPTELPDIDDEQTEDDYDSDSSMFD